MHIFITGATGFIGSYVLKECISGGHTVVALRRPGNSSNGLSHEQGIHWLVREILDIGPQDLEGIQAMIHLAATGISPRTASWKELEEVNIKGTLHLCSLAKALQARLVIAGSYAEYGLSGLRYEEIPVDAPLEPTFPYAVSKAAASLLSLGYARAEDLQLAYLRIFNAFGDGQHASNLWPSLKDAAISGKDFPMTPGQQTRDFIHVSDVARCLVKAATTSLIEIGSPMIKNVGSGTPTTIVDFCQKWWEYFRGNGKLQIGKIEYRKNEIMRYVPEVDTSFIKS